MPDVPARQPRKAASVSPNARAVSLTPDSRPGLLSLQREMFPACYGLAMTRYALIFGRMIVIERGLNILGAQIAERPAQPDFRRRTDGPYTWISFLKAFILSNPRVAATFTVLRATAQRGSGASLRWAVSFHGFDGAPPGILRGLKLVRSRLDRASMRACLP